MGETVTVAMVLVVALSGRKQPPAASLTTSVYRVASTLMNGASASALRRLAISVLPVPVGPFIKIFEGVTSARKSSGSWFRRQRMRIAMAVAFLASSCPMTYLSKCATISSGNESELSCELLLPGSSQTPDTPAAPAEVVDVAVSSTGACACLVASFETDVA